MVYFVKKDHDYSNADKFSNLKSNVSIKEISILASDLTGINKNLLYKDFCLFHKSPDIICILSWSSYRSILIRGKSGLQRAKVPVNCWET